MNTTREALALILEILQKQQAAMRELWSENVNIRGFTSTPLLESEELIGELAALAHGRGDILMPSGFCVPEAFKTVHGFTEALGCWIEARRKKRNPPTGRAIQLLINRLASRPEQAIAALEMATERGWSTIKWDWFDKEQPATGKANGEYPEAIKLPIRNV